MRRPFAHDALLTMDAGGDIGAPGAAITVALCGHWDHEPPCPLAPHHTAAERIDAGIRLRTLFAAEPAREAEVRERIHGALEPGRMPGAGHPTTWTLRHDGPAPVLPEEADHARRLVQG